MKKTMLLKKFALTATLLCASAGALAGSIVKVPDLGAYWGSLSSSGTYTYADSFIAPTTGSVTEMGTWLNGGSSNLTFEILGSVGGLGGNGPDAANVLASSGPINGGIYNSLTFIDVTSGISSSTLIAGNTYWFAATTVGMGGSGPYQVGGHTQNSAGIVDNGTFWYSNDPTGMVFNGQGLTPEMAFSVSISAVPEPETYAMLLAGLGLMGFMSRRRKTA